MEKGRGMDNFQIIRKKLESFIRKFYLNELMKGLIFFVSLGLIYLFITISIEYFLWLKPTGREILFWSFVGVEAILLFRFIAFPLLKLFKLSRGINFEDASRIIGRHFPEVNDKLLNILQLKGSSAKTELLMAGIDQKASELKPVPFSMAVDYRKNLPLLKYAAIPFLIICLIFFSGKADLFSGSYERVVNYRMAYEPPAPFKFELQNSDLKVMENEELKIRVRTEGKVIPANASVHYNGQTYFLNQVSPGIFEHRFEPVQESFQFFFSGNEVRSKEYSVEVLRVPKVQNFQMILNFPAYTGLRGEVIEGTGNAAIPEGTEIKWELETRATDGVAINNEGKSEKFRNKGGVFTFEKNIQNSFDYHITTSNKEVHDFEKLNYRLDVIKDEYPKISLDQRLDSLDQETQHFHGKISDDYGISAVQLVMHPENEPERKRVLKIMAGKAAVGEFYVSFPDTLQLERGKAYLYYFEVTDNDVLNGYKSTKTNIFSYRRETIDEEKEKRLLEQKEALGSLGESLDKVKLSEREIMELSRLEKEKESLSYSDRKKLENFLRRQKEQNRLMETYTRKLKKNLSEENNTQNEELREELRNRISNREKDLQENEKLLEELERISEKINEEGLSEKLEKLSRKSRNQERNLEQLLELTRRYYVQEKVAKISEDLEKLAKEQDELAERSDDGRAEKQDSISEKTKEAIKDLEDLDKENEELKKPLTVERDEGVEEQISSDQEKASEDLKQGRNEEAEKKQKRAGKNLKNMAAKLQESMQTGSMQQMEEDADMLRQILDNLITFSFEQEELMEQFKKSGDNSLGFAGQLRRQNLLRENFQHVDDSLYSLALRNPMLGENITVKISEVDYNIEQSLERFGRNEIRQGVGSQQYVVTGANDLAFFLSNILGNMQQMLSQAAGGGSGKGGEMQLPDIIQKQKELNESMKKAMEERGSGEGAKKEGTGKDSSEEGESGEIFRIFQEQQMLRKSLEKRLGEIGKENVVKDLQKEMENLENRLLEKAFDAENYRRMMNLEHKLLELEEAGLEQGKKQERESESNKAEFDNTVEDQVIRAKEYFKTTEILNRQTLPLRQIYKLKVKEYFERENN